LAEFDLLRHSRTDVRRETWVQPAHREAVTKYFKLCRAQEEIVRLNVEIRRLRTRIHDDTIHVVGVLEDLATGNPPLCAAVRKWWTLRSSVNNKHLQQLDAIERFPGFTGKRGIGRHVGSTLPQGNAEPECSHSAPESIHVVSDSIEDMDANTRQEHVQDIERLTDFIERIAD